MKNITLRIIQIALFIFISATHMGLIAKIFNGEVPQYITISISFGFSLMVILILDELPTLPAIITYGLADSVGVFIYFFHFNKVEFSVAIYYSIFTFLIILGLGLILIKQKKVSKAEILESRVQELETNLAQKLSNLSEIETYIDEIKSSYPVFKSRVEENESKVSNLESKYLKLESISIPVAIARLRKMNEENMTETEREIFREYNTN